MVKVAVLAAVALLAAGALPVDSGPKLTIHEWGTFTSLQDEAGRPIAAINAAVEPLPDFVHTANISRENARGKGIRPSHPDVTMRLETPVLYFHLPPDTRSMTLNVRESFRGGWLTQYYPDATIDAPGIDSQNSHITADTMGSLTWKNLKIGGAHTLMKTDSQVWLAPRDVNASDVQAAGGEAERFLFDRGVGHVDAPLKVSRVGSNLEIRCQITGAVPVDRPMSISKLWLLDIRADGARAFRAIDGFTVSTDATKLLATTPADFSQKDYAMPLQPLMDSMHGELVRAGLFSDEADAMLNTWRAAYFNSQGQRLLFIAPRAWTDHYLPLEVSTVAAINRVMVARVELVTPNLRELARKSIAPTPNDAALKTLSGWRFATPLIQAEYAIQHITH